MWSRLANCMFGNTPTDPKEKTNADYQYRLKVWESIWDKGILALIGIGAVFLLNSCLETRRQNETRDLEKYKLGESRQRFFIEKRLEALSAISLAHNDMTQTFFKAVDPRNPIPSEKVKDNYSAAIDKFIAAINRNLPILNLKFDEDMNFYVNIHRFIRDMDATKCQTDQPFLSDLDNEFNHLCRIYLETGDITENQRMPLKHIPPADRISMDPRQYVDAQKSFFYAKLKERRQRERP